MEETKEQVQEKTLIQQAEEMAKRIEEANKKAEEILKRNEEVLSRQLLSGRASAGTQQPVIDPETIKKEAMKQYFKGTAIEKLIK